MEQNGQSYPEGSCSMPSNIESRFYRAALRTKLIWDLSTAHRCSGPSVSARGNLLSFVSDRDGSPAAWVVARSSLSTYSSRRVAGGIAATFSPALDQLAVACPAGSEGTTASLRVFHRSACSPHLVVPADDVRLGAWAAGNGSLGYSVLRRASGAMQAWLLDTTTGLPKPLTRGGEGDETVLDIDDAARTALVARSLDRARTELLLVDVDSGVEEKLIRSDQLATVGQACFLAGRRRWIAVSTDADRDRISLLVLDPAARGDQVVREISRPDCDVVRWALHRQSGSAAIAWSQHGQSDIELLRLGRGQFGEEAQEGASSVRLHRPHPVVTDLTFTPPGDCVIISSSDPASPASIWSMKAGSGQWVRLAGDRADADQQCDAAQVSFETVDGQAIHGWWFRPERWRAPGPVAVYFHGGPADEARPSFNPTTLALCAHGIAVLAPNVRGSTGRGKAFAALDDGPLRRNVRFDLDATVRWLLEGGHSRPGLVATLGASYGANLAVWTAARHSAVVGAVVTICGLVDLVAYFAETSAWRTDAAVPEYGDPVHDAQLLRDVSSLSMIAAVRSAVLALHGTLDSNVAPHQSVRLVRAASQHGCPARLIEFADEGHGIHRPGNRARANTEIVGWLLEHLREHDVR